MTLIFKKAFLKISLQNAFAIFPFFAYNVRMCWKCGVVNKIENPVSRSAVCESCGADLRCCKNCAFYSPGSHYDCRENVDELVADKERANFCDYFRYSASGNGVNSAGNKKSEDARKAFNSLFGD